MCIRDSFGTATTFDIVNGSGEFVGGIIAPGLNLQLKALNKFTSKLPRIEVALSNTAIGHNTTDAILSGVLRGSASMIDGLIEQCEKELGEKAVVVATGGYSGLIANYLKRPFDFINPTLTLEGLRHLYQINRKLPIKFSFHTCTSSGTESTTGVKFQIYFMFAFTRKSAVVWANCLGTVKIAMSASSFLAMSGNSAMFCIFIPLTIFPIFAGSLSNKDRIVRP